MTRQPPKRKRTGGAARTANPSSLSAASRRPATRTEIAELFGVAATQVDGWRRAGCPSLERGRFQPKAVVHWLQSRDAAKAETAAQRERNRKWQELGQRALAQMRLHVLDTKRAAFMPRPQVAEQWHARVAAVRSRLLALPAEIGKRCANQPSDVVELHARAIVRALLQEFASSGAPSATTAAPVEGAREDDGARDPARVLRAQAARTQPQPPTPEG